MEIPARVLATIDRAALSAADQVHYDLFRRNVEESLEGRRFKGEYMPVTQMGGVQQNVAQTLMLMPYFQRFRLRERDRAAGGGAGARRPDDRAPGKGRGDGDHATAGDACATCPTRSATSSSRTRSASPLLRPVPVLPARHRPAHPGASARGRGARLHRRRWRPPIAGSSNTWRRVTCRARARRSPPATCPTARPGTRSPCAR